MKKYVEIIDKGECCSSMNDNPNFVWPDPKLKKIACKNEWSKHNFYPSNGLVGEVYCDLDSWGHILLISDKYYVPMTKKGINTIAEDEYLKRKPLNKLSGMDQKQRAINTGIDELYSNINNIFGLNYEEDTIEDLEIDEYYHELITKIDELCAEHGVEYTISENEVGGNTRIIYTMNEFTMGIFSIIMNLDHEGTLVNFLVKGFNDDITKLADTAELTKRVFNIPIFKFILLDEDKMIESMLVMPKNW